MREEEKEKGIPIEEVMSDLEIKMLEGFVNEKGSRAVWHKGEEIKFYNWPKKF